MLNNSTLLPNRSQLLKSKNPTPYNLLDPQPKIKFPIGVILGLTPKFASVLNTLIRFSRKYKIVLPSHETIARMSNCHESTVKRALEFLEDRGFISIKSMGCNKSNWYKISKFFNSLDVMKALKTKLPVFFYFCLNLIQSVVISHELRCNNVLNPIIKPQYQEPNTKKESLRKEDIQRHVTKPLSKESYLIARNPQQKVSSRMKDISPFVQSVKSLNDAGKLVMSAYPDLVVKSALNMVKGKDLVNPFGYMRSVADRLCRENNYAITPRFDQSLGKPTLELPVKFETLGGGVLDKPKKEQKPEYKAQEGLKSEDFSLQERIKKLKIGIEYFKSTKITSAASTHLFNDPVMLRANSNADISILRLEDELIELEKRYAEQLDQGLIKPEDNIQFSSPSPNKVNIPLKKTMPEPQVDHRTMLMEVAEHAKALEEWRKENPQFANDPRVANLADKYTSQLKELLPKVETQSKEQPKQPKNIGYFAQELITRNENHSSNTNTQQRKKDSTVTKFDRISKPVDLSWLEDEVKPTVEQEFNEVPFIDENSHWEEVLS